MGRSWKKSLRLQIGLLVVWFVVPYVFGILLAEPLHDEGLDASVRERLARNGTRRTGGGR